MFWFILAGMMAVGIAWLVWREFEDWSITIMVGMLAAMMLPLLAVPLVQASGGMYPGYSQGFRDGYVTKISHRGMIWKTWEGTMQSGSGEMASLQNEYDFSVVDEELVEEMALAAASARRVRLVYTEYLITDMRKAHSGYVVTHMEYLE